MLLLLLRVCWLLLVCGCCGCWCQCLCTIECPRWRRRLCDGERKEEQKMFQI